MCARAGYGIALAALLTLLPATSWADEDGPEARAILKLVPGETLSPQELIEQSARGLPSQAPANNHLPPPKIRLWDDVSAKTIIGPALQQGVITTVVTTRR